MEMASELSEAMKKRFDEGSENAELPGKRWDVGIHVPLRGFHDVPSESQRRMAKVGAITAKMASGPNPCRKRWALRITAGICHSGWRRVATWAVSTAARRKRATVERRGKKDSAEHQSRNNSVGSRAGFAFKALTAASIWERWAGLAPKAQGRKTRVCVSLTRMIQAKTVIPSFRQDQTARLMPPPNKRAESAMFRLVRSVAMIVVGFGKTLCEASVEV